MHPEMQFGAKDAGGGSMQSSQVNSMVIDKSGNIITTGIYYNVPITIGTTTLVSPIGEDIYMAKYNSSGDAIWAKSINGPGDDYVMSVTTDKFDNIYLCGDYGYTLTFDTITLTGGSNFLVKFDSSGYTIWVNNLVGFASSSITATDSGFIYLNGSIPNGIDSVLIGSTTLINHGDADVIVVKYDSEGNVIWGKDFGESGGDFASSIVADTSGAIYITGEFNNTILFDSFTLSSEGDYDFFVAKLSANGTTVWAIAAGGTGPDFGPSITVNKSKDVFIAGIFWSYVIYFGSIELIRSDFYQQDVFVAKAGFTNVLVPMLTSFKGFKVYPNPVQSQLTITLAPTANEVTIHVYDVQGRIIALPITSTNTQAQLSTEKLVDGFYTLQIINNKTGECEVAKFVK